MEKVSTKALETHKVMKEIQSILERNNINPENGFTVFLTIATDEKDGLAQASAIGGSAENLAKIIHSNIHRVSRDNPSFGMRLLLGLLNCTNMQMTDLHEKLKEELL